MLTYKLKLKELDKDTFDKILNYQKDYSHAFRKLFKNYNEEGILGYISKKYNLDSWQIVSLNTEVETKLKQISADKNSKEILIKNIEKQLLTEKNKRTKYKLIRKLNYLNKSLSKDIVFGGKSLLQQISKENNKQVKDQVKIDKLKSEFINKRILPLYVIGEASQSCNRKFNFNFSENKIVFKPKKGIKFQLEFHCSKKQNKTLLKLQELIDNKLVPITVKLSTEYVWIHFDEEKLNNYHFKENELFRELKKIPKENKLERTKLAREFHIEQTKRKLFNKVKDRFMAVDLNPEYIGYCIQDKSSNKIIEKGTIDLSQLSTKLKLSSYDPKQKYQNNKRKFEISNSWKYLFEKAKHYKVANFVIEELNFKEKTVNDNPNESNRKCKNIWHRTLTTNLIKKYCNSLGIELVEINAAYTSFIGNIKYNFFDPCNASIMICNRGMTKFEKNKFYPPLSESDFDTMSSLIETSDAQNKNDLKVQLLKISNWKQLYNFFKQAKFKYRRSLDSVEFREFSCFSWKSRVVNYEF